MCGSVVDKLVLVLVDIVLVVHALTNFFLGVIRTARLHARTKSAEFFKDTSRSSTSPSKVRSSIANGTSVRNGASGRFLNGTKYHHPPASTFPSDTNAQKSNGTEFACSSAHKSFLAHYWNLVCGVLLTFSIALYISCKLIFVQFYKLLLICFIFTRRKLTYLFFVNKLYDMDELHQSAKNFLRSIPQGKALPQSVTIILPSLTTIDDDTLYRDVKLEMTLTVLEMIKIKSVCLYIPFTEDGKLVFTITKLAEKFSNVCCVLSVEKSRSLMLDVLTKVHCQKETVEPKDITDAMDGIHSDLVYVCGGAPSLYGYVPWHTKLSEIFFLPNLDFVTIEDVIQPLASYLSIEQRFGR